MNLREFCGIEGFDTAVLTTYQFDPVFFERVVLRDLIASGVRRVFVLADGQQSSAGIAAARDQLVDLGRRYQVFQAWTTGAFHAKLCVKLSEAGGVVACGSTNLTYPGWLGVRSEDSTAGNREVSGAWRVQPGTSQATDLSVALHSIADMLSDAPRRTVEHAIFSGWLADAAVPAEGRLLVSSTARSLSAQLATRWSGRRFRRLWMATGSTDRGGAMLAWTARTFGAEEAIVEVDPQTATFDAELLAKLPLTVRIRACSPQPRTHLKVAVFEGDDGLAAVYGSANCSAAAWLLAPERGGNVEAVVVLDSAEREAFAALLQLDDTGAVRPAEVKFASLPEQAQTIVSNATRLVHASFAQSTRRLSCTFDRPLDVSASVKTAVDEYEVDAVSAGGETWIATFEALPLRARTRFVTATIVGSETISCACWIEDTESLEAMRARTLDISPITNLDGRSAADPGQTLRGISKLSHWLLGDWSKDEERSAAGLREEIAEREKPATPVTPEHIFQSLDKLKESFHPSMAQMVGGSISLAGIMRLVFGDPAAQVRDSTEDVVASELNENKKTSDDSPRDEEGASNGRSESTGQLEISAADRARLIRQMQRFVESMAEPEFTHRCTARQLQQAVAFPLACSLLAARGDWMQTECDHTGWKAIVRRVYELLLVSRPAGTGSGGGATLIEQVDQRYAREGRAGEFRAIIGDGTLWVLLLAVATGVGVETDPIERDLLLVDVLEYEPLRSNRSAVQLAELCAIAQVEDQSGDWIRRARSAADKISSLIQQLMPLASTLPVLAKGTPLVGDWLWNEGVGFARIEALNDSTVGSVHIRRRAQTRPNVRLKYYVNLRLAELSV